MSERYTPFKGIPKATARTPDGRYVRWSWRYQAWQSKDPIAGTWRNIRPEMARCYVAAGFPIGVQGE